LLANKEADCSVDVSKDDFLLMMQGKLNPMNAVMAGKLNITGDMNVAMKLQSLFTA